MKKFNQLIVTLLVCTSTNSIAKDNINNENDSKNSQSSNVWFMKLFSSCNPFPDCEIHGLEPTSAKRFSPANNIPLKKEERTKKLK